MEASLHVVAQKHARVQGQVPRDAGDEPRPLEELSCARGAHLDAKRLNKTRFYAGELRRLHGEEEFECMAAEGKLIKVEDSDGDECFEKVMRSEIQEVEDSRQARNSKSGRISQNNYDDLGEAVSTELMDAKIKKCKTVDLPLEDCIPEESAQ